MAKPNPLNALDSTIASIMFKNWELYIKNAKEQVK